MTPEEMTMWKALKETWGRDKADKVIARFSSALAERDELKAKQDTLETNFSHLNKRYWEMVTRVKKSEDTLAEFVRRARECQAERDGNKWVSKRFHLIEDLSAEKVEPRKVSVEGEEG